MDNAAIARIEKQRVELEDSTLKLRRSLRHWQTLEIEYEGLKEEFQGLPGDASIEECRRAAQEFKPELVNDAELSILLKDQNQRHRSPSQLVEVLTKRVEYVLRNIDALRKQISAAEKERNAFLLAESPEHQDEANLPLQEISEELDEEGNVVASRVQAPAKEAPDLLQALSKVSVQAVAVSQQPSSVSRKGSSLSSGRTNGIVSTSRNDDPLESDSSEAESLNIPGSHPEKIAGPTNPDDTEEDAALRQEMLRYGMDEVGAIVAEIDLNEDLTDVLYDDDDGDDAWSDEDEDLYSDQSEDERGATKNPVISTKYLKRMEALQRRHGVQDIENLGPPPDCSAKVDIGKGRPPAAEAARKAAIARAEATKSAMKTGAENKSQGPKSVKKVAFSNDLDVAKESPLKRADDEPLYPVGDVMERPTPLGSSLVQGPSTQPDTFSTFRASTQRSEHLKPRTVVGMSSNRLVADKLVERPSPAQAIAPDPSEFDEDLQKRQIAGEYQQMRNRRIHLHGGYVRGGELENWGEDITPDPAMDENTGKPKKVSRFKAARMNQ